MRRKPSERHDLPLMADLNVTSLVDVAFTLLVIFIITAPALQGGIQVDLPEADAAPISSRLEPLVVSLTENGEVFLSQTLVPSSEVEATLASLVKDGQPVFVKADERSRTGLLVLVLSAIENAGGQAAIVTEDRPRSKD